MHDSDWPRGKTHHDSFNSSIHFILREEKLMFRKILMFRNRKSGLREQMGYFPGFLSEFGALFLLYSPSMSDFYRENSKNPKPIIFLSIPNFNCKKAKVMDKCSRVDMGTVKGGLTSVSIRG